MEKKNKKPNNTLGNFKLWAEKDPYPKRYVSPAAGKPKPWYVRAPAAVTTVVTDFTLDVVVAVKIIIKELM